MATLGASYDEGAPLFQRSSAPIASSWRCRFRQLTSRSRDGPRHWRWRSPGCPCRWSSSRTTFTTPASSIRRRGPCRCRWRSTTRASNCSSARSGQRGAVHARSHASAGGAECRRADGSRAAVRVRADRRRTVRAAVHRDRRTRRRSRRRQERRQAGERVVTRGAYDVQLASAAKGLPAEGHVH